jgi:predicted transporter
MPRYYYNKNGSYRGYSLSDRERHDLRVIEQREYHEKHRNDARDGALFSVVCGAFLALTALAVCAMLFLHGVTIAGLYCGVLFWVGLPAICALKDGYDYFK